MFKLPISLGIRYLTSSKGAYGSFYSIISIIGLTIGVGALIIVLSVMNGFERELQTRILGVIPHVLIKSDNPINYKDKTLIDSLNVEDIEAYGPYIELQGLIGSDDRSSGVFISGIVPEFENKMSILPEFMIRGSLNDLKDKSGIVIGSWLSRYLNLSMGDEVTLFTNTTRTNIFGTYPRTIKTKIVGIFELNAEPDQSLVLIHHNFARNLVSLEEGYTSTIRIKTKNLFEVDRVGYTVINQLPTDYFFSTWKLTQGTLFKAIQMEKRLVSLLMFLIVTVASFLILTAIVTTVKSKEREIAVLKTLGMRDFDITIIFLTLGLLISLVGITLGLILGIIITLNLNNIIYLADVLFNYRFLDLDAYFISYFPYEFRLNQFVFTSISAMICSTLFAIYPSVKASKLEPVEILRYE
tara:strand:+ start:2395 stop:3630 length:1236 start_codon:yes stop_codon:yes gene_type:complete